MVILAGFAVSVNLTGYAESVRPPLPAGYEDEDLAVNGSKFRGFAFGAEGLISDWYWMNSLQYVGNKISTVGLDNLNLEDMTSLNPRLLYPYLNASTDLDPNFIAPYSYGATMLSAIDVDQAVALTEKGIANNPTQWRVLQYLGYIHWHAGNYEKAADAYDRGGRIEGAPAFFKLMSAKMRSEGGSRDTARAIYRQALDEAADQQTRYSAELRLQQLDAFDELDIINKLLTDRRAQEGRCVETLGEMIPSVKEASRKTGRDFHLDASGMIADPSGVPYRLDREKCQAGINWPTSKIPPV